MTYENRMSFTQGGDAFSGAVKGYVILNLYKNESLYHKQNIGITPPSGIKSLLVNVSALLKGSQLSNPLFHNLCTFCNYQHSIKSIKVHKTILLMILCEK